MVTTTESIQLTDDQANFLNSFALWLDDELTPTHDDTDYDLFRSFMVLSGSAGTGKTYVSVEAVRTAMMNGYEVIGVAAPTHKAVRIITEKLNQAGIETTTKIWELKPTKDPNDLTFDPEDTSLEGKIIRTRKAKPGVYVGTMHQFLTASPRDQEDEEDDNAEFVPRNATIEQPIAACDLFVCDEASMIGRDYYGHITEAIRYVGNKALLIGDEFQLFPVEKNPQMSLVFSLPNVMKLRQVVRYSGTILKIATQIRDTMEDGLNIKPYAFRPMSQPDLTLVTNRHGYAASDWFKLILQYAEQMKQDRNSNQDWIRVLVYRRKTMEEINQKIRDHLYGEAATNQYFEGEFLFTHGLCSNYIPLDTRLECIVNGSKLPITSRLANSRDYQVKGVRQVSEPIPNPLPRLLPNFPSLLQQANVVSFDAYDKEKAKYDQIEFAVLTAPQLKLYNYNREILEQQIRPIIDRLDYNIAYSNDRSKVADMVADRKILDKFLRNFGYCYNIAEENQWVNSDVKPEDEGFTREVVENGKKIRKRVICKLQPAFCITTHKSQGSTLNHVFINYHDFWVARSDLDTMYRLIYTALTRASESVKVFSLY